MDSLNAGKVQKIIRKRSKNPLDVDDEIVDKNPLDVDDEIVDPNKWKDAENNGRHCDSLQLSAYPRTCNSAQPFALPLLPIPKLEEWCSNTSIVLTGTACRAGTGPPVGVVDIGMNSTVIFKETERSVFKVWHLLVGKLSKNILEYLK